MLFKKSTRGKKPPTSDQPAGKKPDGADVQDFIAFAQQAKLVRSGRLQMVLVAVAIALCTAVSGYGVYRYGYANRMQAKPFVYFELKAINAGGNPVAGAKVFCDRSEMGVTDSFGEWRRFLRVQLGSSLAVRISKTTAQGPISATKNLVIPLRQPNDSEIQLIKTVQLQSHDGSGDGEPTKASASAALTVASASSTAPANAAANAAGVSADFDFSRIALTADSSLHANTVSLIKREAARLGLLIDSQSPWQLKLTAVQAFAPQMQLVQATSSFQGAAASTPDSSFLMNFGSDGVASSRKLFALLKAHTQRAFPLMHEGDQWFVMQPDIAKGFWQLQAGAQLTTAAGVPLTVGKAHGIGQLRAMSVTAPAGATICDQASDSCAARSLVFPEHAPDASWAQANLRLVGNLTADDAVFVSGLVAKLTGEQTWQYWGRPNQGTYLTVIRAGKVRFRTKLFNSPGQTPVLSVHAPAIAKR